MAAHCKRRPRRLSNAAPDKKLLRSCGARRTCSPKAAVHRPQIPWISSEKIAAVDLFSLLNDHIDVTVHLFPARILEKQALQIALATGQSAYDSLYLAAAVQARCRLITADERFVRSIKDPILQPHVVSLNDASLAL